MSTFRNAKRSKQSVLAMSAPWWRRLAALPRSSRATRWSLFGAVLALALVATSLQAQEEECSDFTEDNRPCTAMEEFGYCLTNAMESYETCIEDAGFFAKLGCAIAWDVDYYACALLLPIQAVKTILK